MSSRARCWSQFLRENLRLTGTHVGCDTSQCGACVVHVDGQAVKSCTMLARPGDGAAGHDHRGPGQGRRAAPDAGGLPRASRPAMRLLHAGHDHDRGRHREPQGPQPRRARRSARSSKAISAAAPATTTSSRRSQRAPGDGRRTVAKPRRRRIAKRARRELSACSRQARPQRWRERHDATGIGASVRRKEDHRFITGKGRYTDDINRPGQAYAYFLRCRMPMPRSSRIDTAAARRRCRACSAC